MGESRMFARSGCNVTGESESGVLGRKAAARLTMVSDTGMPDVRGVVNAMIARWKGVSGGST